MRERFLQLIDQRKLQVEVLEEARGGAGPEYGAVLLPGAGDAGDAGEGEGGGGLHAGEEEVEGFDPHGDGGVDFLRGGVFVYA